MNTIDTRTKEQQLSNPVRSYRKRYVGRGLNSIRVLFKDNWVIVYVIGVPSKIESFYLDDKRSESTFHYTHTEKIKQMYKKVDVNEVESVVGARFIKLSIDTDLNDDKVISIFVLDKSVG